MSDTMTTGELGRLIQALENDLREFRLDTKSGLSRLAVDVQRAVGEMTGHGVRLTNLELEIQRHHTEAQEIRGDIRDILLGRALQHQPPRSGSTGAVEDENTRPMVNIGDVKRMGLALGVLVMIGQLLHYFGDLLLRGLHMLLAKRP